MIISRTPYRISFLGGGTDYPVWFREHGGAVLAASINHYCNLFCRILPPFFKHQSRFVWSKIEEVAHHHEIQHPAVRAVLQHLNISQGVEINHQGDLPARSGLGSSSAFTVGLLNSLAALSEKISSKHDLAREAIYLEQEVMREHVGVQDQIITAYGGFNTIHIQPNGEFNVVPLILPAARQQALQQHLLLFFTGISRTASDIAAHKIQSIPQKKMLLHEMQQMVYAAEKILCSQQDIKEFGKLLHATWLLKRQISPKISTPFIDAIYEKAIKAGAIGGKVLGAGGGGFILFFVEPDYKPTVCAALSHLLLVPFEFEFGGSQIVFYDRKEYSQSAITRRDYSHLLELRLARLNADKVSKED